MEKQLFSAVPQLSLFTFESMLRFGFKLFKLETLGSVFAFKLNKLSLQMIGKCIF